jgi:hypothetical protein
MQSVPLYRYWQFGTNVRYLQDARQNAPIHGPGKILANIESLFRRLNELDLRVSIRASAELRKIETELKATAAESRLSASQASKLSDAISDLRKTLEAELKGINAYTVSPKRLNTEKLIDEVESLLAPGVFVSLSPVARHDLAEAAKCVAFERPTAAAFHLMRATEEVLRRYYCHFVRRDRINPMLWYPMLQALQVHHKSKKHEVLHRNLDNIRLSFRNPTQHPDKIYDIQEAQDLFALCVDVINRMQKLIQEGSNLSPKQTAAGKPASAA